MTYTFKPYEKSEILRNHLNLGGENPVGERIDVTNIYIERGGKPWIGVMGEYHYSRAKRDDWYRELCKMKAGGVGIVATYLFWIYHEEIEGEFDFSGDLDVAKFIDDAAKAGLDVVIRIGPWAHGECRNGGFPDWLVKKSYKLRDNNDEYMAKVRVWYEKIYEQVKGKFYKDGGNIIGVQLENELTNNAEHLLALKKLAVEIGFDVPLYTVTGWNSRYGAKIPVDEVLPVFSAYADAPWAKGTHKLPLSHNYVFDKNRNDSAVGVDIIKDTDSSGWRLPYEKYPFAMCELGAGIMATHHRRPIITGMDAYAMSLVKLGSGNNLVGYYMYHGGINKIGKLSTLQESKETGYPNDYPILNYDFHTALTSYGEAREQYALLNILHLFLQDFGEILAPMEAVMGTENVAADNLKALRYSMRTDGKSGFVFINHYQRLAEIEDLYDVVIDTGIVKFPPVNVCGKVSFFMPFNMDLSGNMLEYATAQPLCRIDDTYFFVAIEGITPQYKFGDECIIEAKVGLDSKIKFNNIKIVTLSFDEAAYARRLRNTLYIGCGCNIYEKDGEICAIEDGSYNYFKWNGEGFEYTEVAVDFKPASVSFDEVEEPFVPKYECQLNIGGERKRTWRKISVTGDEGFIEIPFPCDVAQIYADGELVADNFYNGEVWRVPAKLLYGKECYLVTSEMKDDFYREF